MDLVETDASSGIKQFNQNNLDELFRKYNTTDNLSQIEIVYNYPEGESDKHPLPLENPDNVNHAFFNLVAELRNGITKCNQDLKMRDLKEALKVFNTGNHLITGSALEKLKNFLDIVVKDSATTLDREKMPQIIDSIDKFTTDRKEKLKQFIQTNKDALKTNVGTTDTDVGLNFTLLESDCVLTSYIKRLRYVLRRFNMSKCIEVNEKGCNNISNLGDSAKLDAILCLKTHNHIYCPFITLNEILDKVAGGTDLNPIIISDIGIETENRQLNVTNLNASQTDVSVYKVIDIFLEKFYSYTFTDKPTDANFNNLQAKADAVTCGGDHSIIDGHHSWGALILEDIKQSADSTPGKLRGTEYMFKLTSINGMEYISLIRKYPLSFFIDYKDDYVPPPEGLYYMSGGGRKQNKNKRKKKSRQQTRKKRTKRKTRKKRIKKGSIKKINSKRLNAFSSLDR